MWEWDHQHYQVILSTEDGTVTECELDATDAVYAAVLARSRHVPNQRVTHVHARLIGNHGREVQRD